MSQLPTRIRNLPRMTMTQEKNGALLLQDCYCARGFMSRFFGLMGVSELAASEGLLLEPCKDIHMGFMNFSIDAIFLRRLSRSDDRATRYEITSVRDNLQPWRLLPAGDRSATSTLEVQSGFSARLGIRPGDIILCSN